MKKKVAKHKCEFRVKKVRIKKGEKLYANWKIPDTGDLVTNAKLKTKAIESEGKISSITGLVTIAALNTKQKLLRLKTKYLVLLI